MSAMAFDFKKEHKQFYLPKNKPEIVTVPPMNYIAALGAMHSEMGDRKWFWGGVGLQFATGFTVAYLTYH